MILETLASAGISKKAACEKVGVSYPTLILWDSEPEKVRLGEAVSLLTILPTEERRILQNYFVSFFIEKNNFKRK